MTTFAPDVTPRVVFDYQSAGFVHSLTGRVARGTSDASAVTIVRNALGTVAGILAPLLPTDFVFLTGRLYHQDSSVALGGTGLPAQPTGVQLIADYTPMMRATATTFKGSSGGTPWHHEWFGVFWDPSDTAGPAANGKVNSTEEAIIASAIAAYQASSGLVNIAGFHPDIYNYATVKPNDYWVKQARKLFV